MIDYNLHNFGISKWLHFETQVPNNRTWKTPFHIDCKKGQYHVVQAIQRLQSIDLNAENTYGMTPCVRLLDTQDSS